MSDQRTQQIPRVVDPRDPRQINKAQPQRERFVLQMNHGPFYWGFMMMLGAFAATTVITIVVAFIAAIVLRSQGIEL